MSEIDGDGDEVIPQLLARCAFCRRSRVFASMLLCIMCRASFCRGDCHALHHAGHWLKAREQAGRP